MAACLVLARHFIDDIPNALRVLMWCCEDDRDELWRRMVAIALWLGVKLEDFSDRLIIVPRRGLENTLYTTEFGRPMFTPAFEQLRQEANDYDAHVVIADNAAQLYGADENNRHQVTHFMNAWTGALACRTPILLAHPAKIQGSEFSGSTAWENAVRTRLYLGHRLPDQPQDEDQADTVRYLARRKSNYSARDWRRLEYRDGVLVPEPLEAAGGLIDTIRRQKADRVVIDAARRLRDMSVRFTDGSTSPHYLPRLILEYKLAEGLSKRELAESMREAMLAGKLTRGKVGEYGNRTPMHGLIVEG
jgi:hypothetical protein